MAFLIGAGAVPVSEMHPQSANKTGQSPYQAPVQKGAGILDGPRRTSPAVPYVPFAPEHGTAHDRSRGSCDDDRATAHGLVARWSGRCTARRPLSVATAHCECQVRAAVQYEYHGRGREDDRLGANAATW